MVFLEHPPKFELWDKITNQFPLRYNNLWWENTLPWHAWYILMTKFSHSFLKTKRSYYLGIENTCRYHTLHSTKYLIYITSLSLSWKAIISVSVELFVLHFCLFEELATTPAPKSYQAPHLSPTILVYLMWSFDVPMNCEVHCICAQYYLAVLRANQILQNFLKFSPVIFMGDLHSRS